MDQGFSYRVFDFPNCNFNNIPFVKKGYFIKLLLVEINLDLVCFSTLFVFGIRKLEKKISEILSSKADNDF